MQKIKENDPDWSNELAPQRFTAIPIAYTNPTIGYVWQNYDLKIKTSIKEFAELDKEPIWRSREGGAKGTPPTNSSRRRFQFTLASGKSEQFASRSDDGISIFVTEYNSKGEKLGTLRIMNNFKKGMHFPTTAESYHNAEYPYLKADCKYLVTVEYINTIYKGDKDLDGISLHMYRLPIEILDKDKKVVTKLKMAKMAEKDVLEGTGSTATLNIDKDSDRFYVRVNGVGPVQGKFTIKVATIENPDPTYNDNETEIEMKVDTGYGQISKSMLLVSDKVDDEHKVDGIADDKPNDRTHKIQLGGKFQVKSVTFGGKEYQMDNRTPVPVQKTVDVNIVIVRPIDGDENAFKEKVKAYWKTVNERYAQVGVKVNIQGPEVKSSTKVNLVKGLIVSEDGNDGKPLHDQARKVIEELGTKGNASDIHVFYVKKLIFGATNTVGISITNLYYKSTEPDYTFNVFLQGTLDDTWAGYAAAHELGHLLANEDHKSPSQPYPIWHLMYGNKLSTDGITGSRRWNLTNEKAIQGDSHAK